jgi:hypothetical protein
MKVFGLGGETVDLGSLLSHEDFQIMQFRPHFLPYPITPFSPPSSLAQRLFQDRP